MTAVIIEDEPLAVKELEHILARIAPEIQIVAHLNSVRDSIKWLQNNVVDLIFSDIHLGDGQCFEIFRQVVVKVPVIFITAHDEYALQAFKNHGVEYVLKPFVQDDIQRALQKVKQWFGKVNSPLKWETNPLYQERFLVQMGSRIKSIPVTEIAYFMADGKYVMLYTFEGKRYIIDQTIAKIEGRLNPNVYFRINRKFIVNYQSIKDMNRYSNSRIKILLSPPPPDSTEVIVSSERLKEFKEWLNR